MSEQIDTPPESRKETLTRLGSQIVETVFQHGRNISSRYDSLKILYANTYPEVRVSYQDHLDALKERVNAGKEKLRIQRDPAQLRRTLEAFLEHKRWQLLAKKTGAVVAQATNLTAVKQSFETGVIRGKKGIAKGITSISGTIYRIEPSDAVVDVDVVAVEEVNFDDMHFSAERLVELGTDLQIFEEPIGREP